MNKNHNNEPLMSIGLILPEDNQNNVSITLFGEKFSLLIDGIKQFEFKNDFNIGIHGNKLSLNDIHCNEIIIKNNDRELANYIKVDPVIAGRGFHWQKSIDIKVLGDLVVKNIDQQLFVINKIFLEDYLMCVATSEMGAKCPQSLLEAQTIVARSWILAAKEKKHQNLKLDACNDDCCQRYQGISNVVLSSVQAAQNTRGKVLIHGDTICDARYSKNCGGISERGNNVWDINFQPYLDSIIDSENTDTIDLSKEEHFKEWLLNKQNSFCGPEYINEAYLGQYLGNVDEKGEYYRWEISYTNSELVKIIYEKSGKQFSKIIMIHPIERGASGRILTMKIIGKDVNGNDTSLNINSEYEIRRILHKKFLYSSAFIIETNSKHNNEDDFTLKGAGWGHGAGLCQIGALGMSLAGKTTEEIVFHYYKKTKLKDIYE